MRAATCELYQLAVVNDPPFILQGPSVAVLEIAVSLITASGWSAAVIRDPVILTPPVILPRRASCSHNHCEAVTTHTASRFALASLWHRGWSIRVLESYTLSAAYCAPATWWSRI